VVPGGTLNLGSARQCVPACPRMPYREEWPNQFPKHTYYINHRPLN
jgi:hypothetical protein